MNCLVQIKEAQNSYTSTEKLIADYILEHTQDVLNFSAQQLGEKSQTSAAAVIRFSKKIGYKGFTEMKMSLAQSQQTNHDDIDIIINADDDISTLVDKCCRMNMSTVLKTYQLISEQHLQKAIEMLINAKVIYLFGVGGSAIVANDLQQKLIRIGKKVIYNDDLHVQMTFAESMTNQDVAIFISYSGTTKGLADMAKLLKSKRINVISITQYTQNPIGKSSTVNLVVPCEEKTLRLGAISSRISSLVMTDLLYYGVFKDSLDKNKQKLIESRKIVSEM